jgi:hypothetical protein
MADVFVPSMPILIGRLALMADAIMQNMPMLLYVYEKRGSSCFPDGGDQPPDVTDQHFGGNVLSISQRNVCVTRTNEAIMLSRGDQPLDVAEARLSRLREKERRSGIS